MVKLGLTVVLFVCICVYVYVCVCVNVWVCVYLSQVAMNGVWCTAKLS